MTSNSAWGLWIHCEQWIPERVSPAWVSKWRRAYWSASLFLNERKFNRERTCSPEELGFLICDGLQRGPLCGNRKFHLAESSLVISFSSSFFLVGVWVAILLRHMHAMRWRQRGHRAGYDLWRNNMGLTVCVSNPNAQKEVWP